MRDITALGGWPALTVMTTFLAGFLLLKRRWRAATALLASVIGASVIGEVLKALYGRARPDVVPHLADVTSLSFPSGHSSSAAAVYLTLAALLSAEAKERRVRLFIIAAAGALIVLIGVSRVYLGVHYPSDVIAGWAIGAAWASLVLIGVRFAGARGA